MPTFFRSAMLAAAVAGLGLPQAASAAGIWQVERGTGGACTMTATYSAASGDEVSLAFVYDPTVAALSFLAASSGWKDLPKREGNPAPLLLKFDGAAKYLEWESEKAPIKRIAGGSNAVIGEWGAGYSGELAATVTSSTRLALRVGKSDLGTYDLDGVAEAYSELRRCSGVS